MKLLWTREDDMTHDAYRPPAFDQVAGAFDDKGKLIAWNLHLTGPSITARMFPSVTEKMVDPFAVEAAANYPYDVPERARGFSAAGNRHQCRLLALGEPCAQLLRGRELHGRARGGGQEELATSSARRCSEAAPLPQGAGPRHSRSPTSDSPLKGHFHGLAVMEGYGTYMAQVADISVKDGKVKVHRIYCVADCGQQVNPDTVVAQIESSIMFGLSALMWGEINIQNGRVQQTNFDSYRVARMNDAPRIDPYVIDSTEAPGGIGEPATALVAPAVCNAIYAATGRRIRSLPLSSHRVGGSRATTENAAEAAASCLAGEIMSKNADLHKRRVAAIPRGVGNSLAVYAERAQNAELWDVEGRRYVDFASGIAVVNTGHVHPHVKAAMAAQLEKFTHGCFQVDAVRELHRARRGAEPARAGPDAEENRSSSRPAPRPSRTPSRSRATPPKRSAVIAFSGGFHGRTLACIALTGKVQPYKAGFGPMLPEVFHVPFPMAYHGVTRRRLARGHRQSVQGRRRSRARRGDHHRARAGRRRLLHRAAGIPARAARVVRQARHPAHCR